MQVALAGEALTRQLGEIQASGQQKAFENAQQQFERDRAARESAERLGLSAGESLSAQSAQLAQLGDLARKGDVQSSRDVRKDRERSTGKRTSRLRFSIRRFCRQRDYPRESLTFLSSILRGVLFQPSETVKFQNYNPILRGFGYRHSGSRFI